MLLSTLNHLRCPNPRCASRARNSGLRLRAAKSIPLDGPARSEEIVSGSLVCESCRSEYPILGGVAVLVEPVGDYLLSHIKGISREIPEAGFPKAFRSEMARARRELEIEPIEDDLESQRVTALYLITQYLSARQAEKLAMSEAMRDLVERYWDKGPFSEVRDGIGRRFSKGSGAALLELGCGVGGLLSALSGKLGSYLGLDSSFASIALARRIALGIDHRAARGPTKMQPLRVPEDLLFGGLSRDIKAELEAALQARGRPVFVERDFSADFVVGDVIRHPLAEGRWDVSVALNLIDMLDRPEQLPRTQKKLIRPGGWAIQGSPYVWHPESAKALARKFPRSRESGEAVARLYESEGFSVERDGVPVGASANIPWLFFKSARQIELYSVDLFFARLTRLKGVAP